MLFSGTEIFVFAQNEIYFILIEYPEKLLRFNINSSGLVKQDLQPHSIPSYVKEYLGTRCTVFLLMTELKVDLLFLNSFNFNLKKFLYNNQLIKH